MKRYYIGESKPNGTADLLITDIDGLVLGSMQDAVLWPTTNRKAEFAAVTDGESIWGTRRDIGDHEGIPDDMLVWQVDYEDVLKFLAVSPVRSASDAADLLVQARHGRHI